MSYSSAHENAADFLCTVAPATLTKHLTAFGTAPQVVATGLEPVTPSM